ncbi:MAG TPA: phosphatidate cytidylyltransferase [Chitinophagaceae bacterium]|nr:phosphatidate cytidylyltransferase [Chitinophagaceae bacterium]
MPLDTKAFRTRTLTAVAFVIIMLAGLLWNQWSFIVLFIIIHFGCWYEFVRLIKKINPEQYLLISIAGLAYITLPVLILLGMRTGGDIFTDNKYLMIVPCGIIFSIWVNDTMAYIVGSLIGKTPLSKISPKKTWEGTMGGALLCILTITLTGHATGFYSYKDWIVISTGCAVFGTWGDLLESKLKRMAGVKDSGTILPGHGGFLDRFDSLLVASVSVGIYYFLFMQVIK